MPINYHSSHLKKNREGVLLALFASFLRKSEGPHPSWYNSMLVLQVNCLLLELRIHGGFRGEKEDKSTETLIN